ncbi:MAG: hypothetical protein ACI3V0_11225 [Faecousia sp.]
MEFNGILSWAYHFFLCKQFGGDRRHMAIALRVSERTLQKAFDETQSPESALLFEQLMQYCVDNEISMDQILAQYRKQEE